MFFVPLVPCARLLTHIVIILLFVRGQVRGIVSVFLHVYMVFVIFWLHVVGIVP